MTKLYLSLLFSAFCLCAAAQTHTTNTDSLPITKRIFKLGEIYIKGKTDNSSNTISSDKIEQNGKLDVATALNILPGVSLSKVGARNESVVLIRGFDLRQVPVYIDGIPVYVPYDGYVDLGRFTSFDVSQINVAKGFSSITYGANTLGGAINIVSRKPVNKFEIDARSGLMSGDGHRLNLNAGSRLGKFYFQGSISQLKQQGFPLSESFIAKINEDGGRRENAYREDTKYTAKIGFTPKEGDEYAFNYVKQDGKKGNPPYVGDDTKVTTRFWQWPYWNKESYYFLSNTTITPASSIKTRLYYDKFSNLLSAFDDNTYTTQKKGSSFQSIYNDDTYGGSIVYNNQLNATHFLSASAQLKNDRHKEYNVGEPIRTTRDYTASLGLEDAFRLNEKLTLLPGIGINLRKSLQAENYNATTKTITEHPKNDNYALNAQLGAVYELDEWQKINVSVARKTRFATIKDRYSYRMGTAIPNPDLKSEAALHYEAGYTGKVMNQLQITANLFYSRISDAIMQVNNVLPNIFQLQNAGKAEFYGTELSADYSILPDWNLSGQYSYLKRTNLSNRDLKFTDAPDHKLLLSSGYQLKKAASLLASIEYNSSRYSTSYGTKAAGFALTNVGARVKAYRWISLEGGVNNLFDKNYAISEGYPEAGRNYFINLVFNNL
ncbi:TonB-dependent receptor plug domain-containing protein [Pedobacter soli]|uniref:Iron complex outermembrane recepter protein n=1 Tax=Pedobacter soli TaxID=390242 RepID=A0A1G6ZIS0_9SPHI|nr:TonB-dependent receptor [Pedobacter soli]SDE02508.1 iron complex outermembrane recepter protein [Pedobacter soli]